MKKSNLFIFILVLTILVAEPFIMKNVFFKEENEYDKNEIIEGKENYMDNIIVDNSIEENKISKQNVKENIILKNQEVGKSYFDDALFIGDSGTQLGYVNMVNLKMLTFFANVGMSVYNVFSKEVSVPKVGKVKLKDLLSEKKFGKIYIMLGINELGYNMENTMKKYKELVEYIENRQNCLIYIQANLHVTEKKSKTDKIFNNTNINLFNNKIKEIANDKNIFYIDINEKFDDTSGNLCAEYSQDNIHIYAKYYKEWSKQLEKSAVKIGG